MKSVRLTISDETLRDGEQQVGVFFNEETKRTLAHLINQTGVHQIDLMPAMHETEERLVKTLVAEGLRRKVAAATMMDKEFIDQSQACGVEQIILFYAVSDRLLFLRDPEVSHNASFKRKTVDDDIPKAVIHKLRQNMIDKVLKNLRYATELGLKVCFAAEDASRADFYFLAFNALSPTPYLYPGKAWDG
jgi:isopropylmalate/homocitrate/citramalate synthase